MEGWEERPPWKEEERLIGKGGVRERERANRAIASLRLSLCNAHRLSICLSVSLSLSVMNDISHTNDRKKERKEKRKWTSVCASLPSLSLVDSYTRLHSVL
jgi:formate dehydrogenase maturation protein FdhE